jgi:hypothetical protein
MAVRPEVLAQLARMLGDDALRVATDAEVQEAVDAQFGRLAEALVAETAASDDVFDRASALAYLDSRLETLSLVLSNEQADRLRSAAASAISDW